MNIKFKHIHIENFLSLGCVDLDLDSRGYVLVSGINKSASDNALSNGSGKSSLWEALVYGITGDTIRGITKVVNINSKDGALVDITFDVDDVPYRILRSKDHSQWKTTSKIWVNGEDKSGKGVRDTDKIISEYLPDLSSQIIGSVIVLGQGLPQRFTNNTPSGRKEVLEKLTKSDYMVEDLKNRINTRRSTLAEEMSALDLESASLQGQMRAIDEQAESLRATIESASDTTSLQELLDSAESEMELTCEEYNTLLSDIIDMEESVANFRQEYAEKSAEKNVRISEIEAEYMNKYHTVEIAELTQRKNHLENECKRIASLGDVCPTCGQPITEEYKSCLSTYEDELEDVGEKIDEALRADSLLRIEKDMLISDTNSATQKALQSITTRANELKNEIQSKKSMLASVEKHKGEIDDSINNLRNRISVAEMSVQTAQGTLDSLMAKRKTITDTLLYNEVESHTRSEHLGILSKFNSAVTREFRGYILSGIIDFINKTAKQYALFAFGNDNLSFELDKNNITVKFNDKEYESLSGGEKQKIDVVIQLALRNVLCHFLRFSTNIIVVDEVFDNLDAVGCQQIIDLMANELKDVSSVYIVTHHASDLSIPYDEEITVVKSTAGISEI